MATLEEFRSLEPPAGGSERLAGDDNALIRKFRNLISIDPADGAGQGSE